MFEPGDHITFPAPDDPATMVKGTFLEIAVGEPIDGRDSAWVRHSEGEGEGLTARVPYWRIRAAG
jgi:hypothetical protein